MNKGFNDLEKYVVAIGENDNFDRCLIVPVTIDNKELEVTMCMDEIDEAARVCQINGNDIIPTDELLLKRVLVNLRDKANTFTYSKEDNDKHKYYLEEIKMSSECCEDCDKCFNCRISY